MQKRNSVKSVIQTNRRELRAKIHAAVESAVAEIAGAFIVQHGVKRGLITADGGALLKAEGPSWIAPSPDKMRRSKNASKRTKMPCSNIMW